MRLTIAVPERQARIAREAGLELIARTVVAIERDEVPEVIADLEVRSVLAPADRRSAYRRLAAALAAARMEGEHAR